ncbi:MAG: spondin domain-containing protein [Chloroflexota bacterium]
MRPQQSKLFILPILGLLSIILFLSAAPQAEGQSRQSQASETAQYKIVFEADWDPASVPNPHFSGLIGASHNDSTVIWEVGGMATDGIEIMAETGSTNQLRSEINGNSNANQVISGGSIPNSPSSVEISSVTLDLDYPLVTLVSMIAPSPDWFVGVSGLSLTDQNGEWINELEIQLFPYDSGTDSSTTFVHSENDTDPAEPISRIDDDNLFPNLPLGTFTFTRLDGPDPTLTPTSTAVPTETATPLPTEAPTETPTAVPTESPEPPSAAAEMAEYRIEFNATWDPTGVPFPHFSPLIGAAHNSSVIFWEVGGIATDGIEIMAETGGTSTFRSEISASSDANQTISGGGIVSPGSTTIDSVTIDQDYPLVSLVTMIAPSPDWFVGVNSLSLVDSDGEWIDQIVIDLRPYDAGTDSGPSFTSSNDDTNPAEAIFRIEDDTLFPAGTLGTFTFTRLDAPPLIENPMFVYLPIVQEP